MRAYKGVRGFFYFGGTSGSSDCSGMNGKGVCARYQVKGNTAEIPWLTKIDQTIPKLEVQVEKAGNRILAAPSTREARPQFESVSGRKTEMPLVQTEINTVEPKQQPGNEEIEVKNTAYQGRYTEAEEKK
ncbi:hypothetical protein, unlikely [Trypanosoma congolense IL3000]|uniref:Variant surface glycoprotein n=1 Tax=Trypanosoma congolense (strain IL3000) TaxID=1068625 RepID=F9WJL8_TRYCI|nr:hypothetical protein, unlikely [Trypanosoma congolense IL3000]